MSVLTIANRYAKSIFQLALEQNKLEEVKADMELLRSSWEEPSFAQLCQNPLIKANKKKQVFHSLFKGKVQDISLNLLDLLADKSREAIIPYLHTTFTEFYNEHKHIEHVRVISAVPLDATLMEKLKVASGKYFNIEGAINLTSIVDPSIIGGVILDYKDQRVNMSVKQKFEKLKKSFS